LPICGSFKSEEEFGPQIAKIIAEGPQKLKKKLVRKFADLRFEERICGPPTLPSRDISKIGQHF